MRTTNSEAESSYRYLHVVSQDGGFCSNLVRSFLSDLCNTDIKQHLFITTDSSFYDKCRNSCRMVLVEKQDELFQNVNRYGKKAKIIFLHGLWWKPWKLFRIHPRLFRKVIWRTWGHDIKLPTALSKDILRFIYRWIKYLCLRFCARRFLCIGCANIVDIIKAHRAFGEKIKTCIVPYSAVREEKIIRRDCLQKELETDRSNPFLRIMIGHSGFPADRQIEIMEKLKHLSGENIRLFLPLAYGDEKYIKKVVGYAEDNFPGCCEILRERVPYEDYARYIHSVDVSVMAAENSTALGNIDLLVFFKKPIYFDKNGDFARAFEHCGLSYGNIEDLDTISQEKLGESFSYDENARAEFCKGFYDEDYGIDKWNYIFNTYG